MGKTGPTQDQVNDYYAQQAKHIEEFGFTVRAVFGYNVMAEHDLGKKRFVDYHTFGLKDSFDHPELQVIFPVDAKHITHIYHEIVEGRIKKGYPLEDGEILEGYLVNDYVMKVVKINHPNVDGENREYMRLLIPDVNNKFPTIEEQPDSAYAYQLERIDYETEEV